MPNPDWTASAPGPTPPGATSPTPTPTTDGWSGWISGIADLQYGVHYPASTYTPQYEASIDSFELGEVVDVPIEGSNPSDWVADGATSDSFDALQGND